MIEINTKIEGDIDYNPDELDITNEFTAYLQQLKNVFSVEPGAVMGAEDMTINLEQYIYEYGFSEERLSRKIKDVIFSYCTFSQIFRTTVKVKFAKGTKRDLAFIDIIVDDKSGSKKKISIYIK